MPLTQSDGTSSDTDWLQWHSTMPVVGSVGHPGCVEPFTGPIDRIRRPPAPPYHPKRYISSVNDCAGFTETLTPIDSPLFTLVVEAYPLIWRLASVARVFPAEGIRHPVDP